LQLVLLQAATGTRFVHVVYQGDPQLRTAVLGKQVDCMGLNLGPVTANQEKLRVLSQGGATRSRFRQDVPTLKELGFPVQMASERGLVMAAGTPASIVQRLREATADIARDPEFVKILESRFTEPSFESGEAWFTRLRALEGDYKKLWQTTPWSQK
jgi:tripartite-type tricarboxylate transporter receptor subunit TctC